MVTKLYCPLRHIFFQQGFTLNRLCSDEQNEIQTMPPKAAPKAGNPPNNGGNGNAANNGNPPNGGNGNAANAANAVPPMVEDTDWGTWEALKASHSGEVDDPELTPLSASSGISPDMPMLFGGGLGSVIFRLWLIPLVRKTFFFFTGTWFSPHGVKTLLSYITHESLVHTRSTSSYKGAAAPLPGGKR